MDIIDILGWVGAIVLLLAFGLSMRKVIGMQTMTYVLLNLIGSLCLVINAYALGVYPFLIINVFWLIISSHQLVKMLLAK